MLFDSSEKLSNKFTLYYIIGQGDKGKFINYYVDETKFMQALNFGMHMEDFYKNHGVKWIHGYKFETYITADLLQSLLNGEFRTENKYGQDTKHCTLPGYSNMILIAERDYTKELEHA